MTEITIEMLDEAMETAKELCGKSEYMYSAICPYCTSSFNKLKETKTAWICPNCDITLIVKNGDYR